MSYLLNYRKWRNIHEAVIFEAGIEPTTGTSGTSGAAGTTSTSPNSKADTSGTAGTSGTVSSVSTTTPVTGASGSTKSTSGTASSGNKPKPVTGASGSLNKPKPGTPPKTGTPTKPVASTDPNIAHRLSVITSKLFKNPSFWKSFKGTFNDDEGKAVAAFDKWWGTTIQPDLSKLKNGDPNKTLLTNLKQRIKTAMLSSNPLNNTVSWKVGKTSWTINANF